MGKAVRLDKFLADSGAGTRTEVKKFIQKGMVLVNGEKMKRPEIKVDPEKDIVLFGGEQLGKRAEFVYYLLNKPAGYVSATEDNRENTVLELIPKDRRRSLFPVGRLDKDTEGLLLITDDGQLAHQLLSPKKHVDKTYFAVTAGKVENEDIKKVKEGVDIGDEALTLPGKLEILRTWQRKGEDVHPELEIFWKEHEDLWDGWMSEILLTIHEGRFHQVKRMMETLGKKVIYLKRISMGSLTLPEELPKGQARQLTEEELAALQE